MKKISDIIVLAIAAIVISSCTNSPSIDPERTSAKALVDQAKTLDSINHQLKRIADALEKK